MSTLSTTMEQILDGMLSCYDAESVTIDGTAYACSSSEMTETNELVLGGGGLIDEPSVSVCVKASLVAKPAQKTRAIFRSKTFKINSIRLTPDGTQYIFELVPAK